MVADQPHYSGLQLFQPGAEVRLGIEPTQVRFLHN
jgi:iron(III) transport system ATP-binding protein